MTFYLLVKRSPRVCVSVLDISTLCAPWFEWQIDSNVCTFQEKPVIVNASEEGKDGISSF